MAQANLTAETANTYIKLLLYGPKGAGKTKLCADAPDPEWWDFEGSTETLKHWPEYRNIPVKKPDNVMECFKYLKQALAVGRKTVVLDTVTSALMKYMRAEAEERADKRDEFTFYEADYKYATQVFSKLFGALQDAPINVVIIGHRRQEKNKDGNITDIFPGVTPAIQEAMTMLVNEVFYLEDEPGLKGRQRKLYVNRTKIIEAKNRQNIQEDFLVNPEWKTIYNA